MKKAYPETKINNWEVWGAEGDITAESICAEVEVAEEEGRMFYRFDCWGGI